MWDDTGTVAGREVQLVGFVVRADTGETRLARLAISCCAADANPITVRARADGLLADQLASTAQDSWVNVRGVHVDGTGTPADQFVPALTVTGLEPVAAPAQPYES